LTMVDLSQLSVSLSAISSIAVIAGAGFVVIQLRQNAGILNASLRQEKKEAAYSMLERLTDESFAGRRANFYKVIEKYKKGELKDFDDSQEDFEVRNFAYLYELHGQLVRDGMIDFHTVAEMLQYLAVLDWKEFEPLSKYYSERWGLKVGWWKNFAWLAKETEKYMARREEAGASSA
jgi:hypothetical protein